MKKIFTVVLILVVNFGFSQLNGVYKSKDNLYKLKISNYSKQDQSFNFVWEAIDANDICSCGGEGIAQEDTYEPKNGEFFLTADDPEGGFNNILQFNLKPNNILNVNVVGDINNLWLCGSGCRIGNEIFYKDGESEPNKLPEPTAQNYYDNGNIKFNSKDYKGAIEDYSNAINLSPECSFCYQLRGFSKGELNDYDGSISDYKKAIEFSDGNLDFISPCQLNIGITYCVIGKKEEGCNFLKDSQNNGNKEAQKYIDQFCGESEPKKQFETTAQMGNTTKTIYDLLQGKWQDTSDKTNFLIFEKNHRKEIAGGMNDWDDVTYSISNSCFNSADEIKEEDKYMTTSDEMCYYIIELTSTKLSLSYVSRGNTLTYIKVQ